jgi:hypothetical protein
MSESDKPIDAAAAIKAVCLVLASAFAGGGAKVLYDGDYVRGGAGLIVGAAFVVIGLTVSLWKDKVSATGYRWFTQIATAGLPLVLGLFLLFVLGVISPRSPATVGNLPSADEIAAAVAKKLPPAAAPAVDVDKVAGPLRAQIATLTQERDALKPFAPAPFVNPFHESLVKWNIVEGIRLTILRAGISPDCHVTIVRLQEAYPEDFSAELMRILDVIGWKYDEQFASRTVKKNVTVRVIDYRQTPELRAEPAPAMECAQALSARFENSARTRHGNPLNGVLEWITFDEAPDYLKRCRKCFEVDFGNEDLSR